MLGVKKVCDYDVATMDEFFGDRIQYLDNPEELYQHGFYVEWKREKKGFFALCPVEENGVWLKSLYIHQDMQPEFILTLLEAIQAYAKEEDIHNLYVFCKQNTIEMLLDAHKFHPLSTVSIPALVEYDPDVDGSWWCFSKDEESA